MRIVTFSLVCLIIGFAGIAVTPKITRDFRNLEQVELFDRLKSQSDKRAAWQTLLKFENQPLSKLPKPQAKELKKAIADLVGKRENEIVIPRLLTTVSDSKGQTRYALIEESPLVFIPGNSGLRVHVFTHDGLLVRS